jgi:hypothetical protein
MYTRTYGIISGPWVTSARYCHITREVNGCIVYLIEDDGFTKMYSSYNGTCRYYEGRMGDFCESRWSTYTEAPVGSYVLNFHTIINSNPMRTALSPNSDPVEAYGHIDPYVSNQGSTGTCARHAIAKAIYREFLQRNLTSFNVEALVNFLLITQPREAGLHGAYQIDWDGIQGICFNNSNDQYEMGLSVKEVDLLTSNFGSYDTISVDMHHYLPAEYNLGSMHAMFVRFHNPETQEIIAQNSWGAQAHPRITIKVATAARQGARVYAVTVRKLVKLVYNQQSRGTNTVFLCDQGVWNLPNCEIYG